MNEIEEILNSGKLYHVMDVTSKDTHYHEYLRKNVYINFNCTFVDDAQIFIGDNSVIGACSVVTKDIPPNVIAFGNPIKIQRELTEDDKN